MSAAAQAAAPPSPALVAVYREHFQFVWRSARRLGAPAAALDDVVQDVFLIVARRLTEFRGEASMRTWLFAITMRVVQVHRRSASRHLRRVEAFAEAHAEGGGSDPYARKDATDTLLKLLDQLDDERRAVFVLAELEGMTAQEIAAGLALNVNTVYSRLRAARQQLERALPAAARTEVR
ncbi:RNA polymerase sigma factor [Nannocystis pusilla]|uniref:RNA polymerase sigma factor n=1 Tax=Nannocystis pusilla TaxID=889268 RepID=UPI003BF2F8D6